MLQKSPPPPQINVQIFFSNIVELKFYSLVPGKPFLVTRVEYKCRLHVSLKQTIAGAKKPLTVKAIVQAALE